MAKPAWIEITNGASGSGYATRTLKAKAHTGRLSRSGSIKGTVSSGESDSVSLSQIGANEFISINSQSYSVAALGGVVTITGTSNSPSLKITNLSNASIISSRSLKIDGETYIWDGDSSHLITNDPGASNSYTFAISISISENKSESSRSTSFYLSDSGSTVVKTSTISISQAAGAKSYGSESFDLNYNIWDIPASGGTASCIYSFSIPWGWNGKTSGGGTLTQNDSHTIEFYYAGDGPSDAFDWDLDSGTGDIVMSSLGTNETSGSGEIYIQAEVTIQGKTIYAEDYVQQQANTVSYRLGNVELSVDDIPASGGTASVNFISGVGYTNYSSGESSTTSLGNSDVSIDHNDVSADNLGTTVKSRTKVGTLNVTVTWNHVTEFPSLDVYQEANKIEKTSKEGGDVSYSNIITGRIYNDTIPASGGSGTASAGKGSVTKRIEPIYNVNTYTSGSIDEVLSSYGSSGAVEVEPSVRSITATASSKGTTISEQTTIKSQDVTWSIGGESISDTMYIYQEANKMSLSVYEIDTNTLKVPNDASTYQVSTLLDVIQYYEYTSGERTKVLPTCFSFSIENPYDYISIVNNGRIDALIGFTQNTGDSRSGVLSITISTVSEGVFLGSDTVYVSFIQAAKKADPTFDIDHDEFYANGKLTSNNNDTIAVLTVTDNDDAGWKVEVDSAGVGWLFINFSSSVSGTGLGSLSITVAENTTRYDRDSDIILYSGGEIIDSINIVQLAISKVN